MSNALDRANEIIIDGYREREQRRHEADLRIAQAVMSGEPVVILGMKYVPANEDREQVDVLP